MRNHWIGVAALVVPFIGYGLVFVYEWGYFNVFNVPIDLINIGLSSNVVVA